MNLLNYNFPNVGQSKTSKKKWGQSFRKPPFNNKIKMYYLGFFVGALPALAGLFASSLSGTSQ